MLSNSLYYHKNIYLILNYILMPQNIHHIKKIAQKITLIYRSQCLFKFIVSINFSNCSVAYLIIVYQNTIFIKLVRLKNFNIAILNVKVIKLT